MDDRDGLRPSSASQGRYGYSLMIRVILCFGMFLYSGETNLKNLPAK